MNTSASLFKELNKPSYRLLLLFSLMSQWGVAAVHARSVESLSSELDSESLPAPARRVVPRDQEIYKPGDQLRTEALIAERNAHGSVTKAPKPQRITLKVYGLVCDLCAQAMVKTLLKEPVIRKVDFDLDTKQVFIESLRPVKEEVLRDLVERSGYSLVSYHSVDS